MEGMDGRGGIPSRGVSRHCRATSHATYADGLVRTAIGGVPVNP